MNIVYRKLSDLKPYEKNPRKNDNSVEAVANSIREFGFKVPIVIDKDGTIVTGHTRYKASKLLKLKEVPCIVADDLTEEQIKAFRLADNKVGETSEWDMDLLGEELGDIMDLDMAEFGFGDISDVEAPADENTKAEETKEKVKSLSERFLVPPFSVFNTMAGYWRERKAKWMDLIGDSGDGREDGLAGFSGGLASIASANLTGTSVFDPCLCEIAYRWFCTDGGKVFDPFAGGNVRGLVGSILGYDYTGIDLRQEQIDANEKKANEIGYHPHWICDDSQNADKYVSDESCDMILSCPPYGDLEKYSDDPRDISNMKYDDFLSVYRKIISIAVRKLKQDRFAFWVVADIRDKEGFFRDFVGDTIRAFEDYGAKLYNRIVLLNSQCTAKFRVASQFQNNRKVVKIHQNVLVFYKGDPKRIRENFKEVDVSEDEEEN